MNWTPREVDEFVSAYVTALLWSSTDEHGESFDDLELSESARESCESDCRDFLGTEARASRSRRLVRVGGAA